MSRSIWPDTGLCHSSTPGLPGEAAQPSARPARGGEGASPRSVIRGESSSGATAAAHPFAAFTDYLTVTFPYSPGEEGLAPLLAQLYAVIGDRLGALKERRGGFLGFKRC